MKKRIVFIASAGIIFLFTQSFRSMSKQTEMPGEIDTIMKATCYKCHFTGTKAYRAIYKINFDKWDQYEPIKRIALLGDMRKMLEEEKMPPKKFQKNNPDAQLTEDQRNLLIDWTKKESETLMQEN